MVSLLYSGVAFDRNVAAIKYFIFTEGYKMKAFKRFTALTLTVAMLVVSLFTISVSADSITFSDVDSQNAYSAAIQALVGKGIINGYEDGTFKPDNTITRAEFAKMLILALSDGVTYTVTTDRFPDLAKDHWANVYINAAVSLGAINGYDDGTFRPENPVTYGEAVKMLVCAMGYGSLVGATTPWYQGYINLASSINLLRGAVSTGDAQASRGLIAQLVYNKDTAKKLTQTGTDINGKPIYGKTDDDTEKATGVVKGVFDSTLDGKSLNLTRNEIMVDDVVYNIGNYKIDTLKSYLGRNVEVKYEDGAKKVLVSITESGSNNVITIEDLDIISVKDRTITYYNSNNDEKTARLADGMYVIYNGKGVDRSLIDDAFINKYFDVSCGEISLLDNGGNSGYDIATIKSYDTYYVSSTTTTENGVKIYDNNYSGAAKELELKTNDCNIYKVTSKGGSKTSATSFGISTGNVVSVAAPINDTDGIEVVVCSAKVTGSVDSVKTYEAKIAGTTYDLSDYYIGLKAEDADKFGFDARSSGTFSLDFKGRVVFYKKGDAATTKFGYLINVNDKSLSSGNIANVTFLSQEGTYYNNYTITDKGVKINGKRYTDYEEIRSLLEGTAATINTGKKADITENADVAQVIKYTLSGSTFSEIFTISEDSSALSTGEIIPMEFKEKDAESKTAFNSGTELRYDSSSKNFKNDKSTVIVPSASAIIFSVPNDRADKKTEYKKLSVSSLTNGTKCIAEPYTDDSGSISAKVIVIYGKVKTATIKVGNDCILVGAISDEVKDDKNVKTIEYVVVGSDPKDVKTISTDPDLDFNGVNPGDVIRIATENSVISDYQKVYVGGELYDYDDDNVLDTFKATDNYITHKSGTTNGYYRVVLGSVDSTEKDSSDKVTTVYVSNQSVDNDADYVEDLGFLSDTGIFPSASSAKYYKWNKDSYKYELTTVDEIVTVKDSGSASKATKVLAIYKGATKGFYIIED